MKLKMPNYKFRILVITLLVFVFISDVTAQQSIRLNQVGFYPGGPKFAVAAETSSDLFFITSPDLQDTFFTKQMGAAQVWPHSSETVKLIDFTEFQDTGTYTIVIEDLGQSYPFQISDYIHQQLSIALIKSYYYQRASIALTEQFAGVWKRPAGHPDNNVYIHASAATDLRPANTIISSPKGWYDAGDYGKYIVNSGISTYSILAAYEHFAEYYQKLRLNIPESANNIPDILDEALWNLRWMLTMQDPNDGGVYHKLTTANFSGFIMPHADNARRYVVQKSTPATLDFAAVMAQASRIFSDFDSELPGLADSCLSAALYAWNWARSNSNVRYNQSVINSQYDPDINTGEYGDGNFSDEFQWASAELFITTKEDSFITISNPLVSSYPVPWWGGVNTLGLYSLVFHRKEIGFAIDTTQAKNALINLANGLRYSVSSSAYHTVMGESNGNFGWGSNGSAANQGMVLMQAYVLTGDESFREAAVQNLDYILGRNAVGYSFVTGAGSKSPRNPHHRIFASDGISNPIPGFVVGGPNPGREDGCAGYLGTERAKSYVDASCSYASNETAINWNAPLVYLAGAIEASYSATGEPLPVSIESIEQVVPEDFGIIANYPNPFNPSTKIVFSLPSRANVIINVYNITGQLIRTIKTDEAVPGVNEVTWDGCTDAGIIVPSGVYLVRLNAQLDGEILLGSRKVMLLK